MTSTLESFGSSRSSSTLSLPSLETPSSVTCLPPRFPFPQQARHGTSLRLSSAPSSTLETICRFVSSRGAAEILTRSRWSVSARIFSNFRACKITFNVWSGDVASEHFIELVLVSGDRLESARIFLEFAEFLDGSSSSALQARPSTLRRRSPPQVPQSDLPFGTFETSLLLTPLLSMCEDPFNRQEGLIAMAEISEQASRLGALSNETVANVLIHVLGKGDNVVEDVEIFYPTLVVLRNMLRAATHTAHFLSSDTLNNLDEALSQIRRGLSQRSELIRDLLTEIDELFFPSGKRIDKKDVSEPHDNLTAQRDDAHDPKLIA